MRIFDVYIIREFIKPIYGSVVLIVGILIVSRVMDDMGWTLGQGQPLEYALYYWAWHIPEYIAWVLPMGMLFATSYTLGSFNKNNELVALMAGGVSFFRVTVPMIIISFLVSIISFFLNDTIVVYGNQQRDFYNCYISKWPKTDWCDAEFSKSNDRNNIKVRSPRGDKEVFFISAKKLLYSNKELIDVDIILRHEGQILERIIAAKARYENNKWYFFDGIRVKLDGKGNIKYQNDFRKEFFPVYAPFERLLVKPRKFNIKIVRGNSMNMEETLKYVQELKAAGKPFLFELVEYHSKISVPFMAFILTLIGAATGSRMKKAVIFLAFTQSLLIAFIYILFIQLGRILGRQGLIHPIIAAWMGNVLFGFVGVFLFKKSNY